MESTTGESREIGKGAAMRGRQGAIAWAVWAGAGLVLAMAGTTFGQDASSPPGAPAWERTFAAGLNLTDGNSQALTVNASVQAQRETDEHAIRLGLEGNYGEADSRRNTQNAKVILAGKRKLSAWYAYTDDSVQYDEVAQLDYRAIVGLGVGKFLADTERAKFGVELGVAYVAEQFSDDTSNDYLALRVAERAEYELSDNAKAWESVEFLPSVTDEGAYLANAEAGVEAVLREGLSLRLVVQDRYNSAPAAGTKKNDLAVIGALVVKL